MTQILTLLSGPAGQERHTAAQTAQQKLKAVFGKRRPYQATRYVRRGCWRFLKAAAPQTRGLRWWGWWYYRGPAWPWIPCLAVVIPFAFVVPPAGIALLVVLWKRSQRD